MVEVEVEVRMVVMVSVISGGVNGGNRGDCGGFISQCVRVLTWLKSVVMVRVFVLNGTVVERRERETHRPRTARRDSYRTNCAGYRAGFCYCVGYNKHKLGTRLELGSEIRITSI